MLNISKNSFYKQVLYFHNLSKFYATRRNYEERIWLCTVQHTEKNVYETAVLLCAGLISERLNQS
jgi:hypothetical protein